ncbi:hypothetical protein GA0070609_6081 [Micromonospora echinaurantiaca]|uniref:Uncharacterized protein n=1 Tax=Micromonospora echinaurantiaca TaxID=47857 RepID=A0A1C5KB82_9ACTN|nr:hypothetical protein GA0070609_6081 [Micromonospora echinaurantiaca]
MTRPSTVRCVTNSPQQIRDDAAAVLHSALAGDGDAVVGTFDAVVDRSGLAGAYGVAWCLAAAMVGDEVPRGACALDFPGIDQAGYDTRWVARFVSAYANADVDTGEALFGAAAADGLLSDCLLTLAGSTVATLRHRAG